MGAINECPTCGNLATAEPGSRIASFYAGVCAACWRSKHPGKELPLPSLEFFAPSALAESKLFKKSLEDVWDAAATGKLDWA